MIELIIDLFFVFALPVLFATLVIDKFFKDLKRKD